MEIQMGRTKIFMRRPAFEKIEPRRNKLLEICTVKLQSFARMCLARIHLLDIYWATLTLQRIVRMHQAIQFVKEIKRHVKAATIQKYLRSFFAERRYSAAILIAQFCQKSYRGVMARDVCALMIVDRHALSIQTAWRRFHMEIFFQLSINGATRIQQCYRCYMARNKLQTLKRKARNFNLISLQRDEFREEARQLRIELESLKKELILPDKLTEIDRLKYEVIFLQLQLAKLRGIAPNSPYQKIIETYNKNDGIQIMQSANQTMNILRLALPIHLTSDVNGTDPKCLQGNEENTSDEIKSCNSFKQNYKKEYIYEVCSSFHSQALFFHEAICDNNEGLVSQILEQSMYQDKLVNECSPLGLTPLHLAVSTRSHSLVKNLLDYGAAANCQDRDGNTPLHLATGDSELVLLLLEHGNANPDIPNDDGFCALHNAIDMLNVASVQHLVRHNADINLANYVHWQTPLHFVARSTCTTVELMDQTFKRARARIASQLCSVTSPKVPGLDFCDVDGNTPLHLTVMLEIEEACNLLRIFLDSGAEPNVKNLRGQTALHLLCHNEGLRRTGAMQEMLHNMLYHGANPNAQSKTGCTALHLALYHKNIAAAIQLVYDGAELHILWKKPQGWKGFWDSKCTNEVLPLDMISDDDWLYQILAAISKPQKPSPKRSWCLHCKDPLGKFVRAKHCQYCGRLVCKSCFKRKLKPKYFPRSFEIYESALVCVVCEEILTSREKEEDMSNTQPTSSLMEGGIFDENDSHF